jgi:acyl-CoA thioester hydrolase
MTHERHGPAAGWFEGQSFFFPIRVYYEDTDFSGVVYHASYLRFMERGRSEFLRAAGVPHQALLEAEEPAFWVVRRMTIDFLRPARVEETLVVRTKVSELGGARMRLEQAVVRGSEIVAKAEVEVCVVGRDGKLRRVPQAMRRTLETYQ